MPPASPNQAATPDRLQSEKQCLGNDEFVEESNPAPALMEASALSREHRDYLLNRHGTLDLDPMPDMKDADPYNWSAKKVLSFSYLILVGERRRLKIALSLNRKRLI
jgi:hypothetical protein